MVVWGATLVETASSSHEPFGNGRRWRRNSKSASWASPERNRGVQLELGVPTEVVDVADGAKPHLHDVEGVNRCGCT